MKDFSKTWLMSANMITAIMLSAFTVSVPHGSFAQAQEEPSSQPAPTPLPQIIKNIQVQGNQRVEANTVASYLLFAPGDPYSEERIDLSIKTLYATGLFADVAIDPRAVSYTHLTLPTICSV